MKISDFQGTEPTANIFHDKFSKLLNMAENKVNSPPPGRFKKILNFLRRDISSAQIARLIVKYSNQNQNYFLTAEKEKAVKMLQKLKARQHLLHPRRSKSIDKLFNALIKSINANPAKEDQFIQYFNRKP